MSRSSRDDDDQEHRLLTFPSLSPEAQSLAIAKLNQGLATTHTILFLQLLVYGSAWVASSVSVGFWQAWKARGDAHCRYNFGVFTTVILFFVWLACVGAHRCFVRASLILKGPKALSALLIVLGAFVLLCGLIDRNQLTSHTCRVYSRNSITNHTTNHDYGTNAKDLNFWAIHLAVGMSGLTALTSFVLPFLPPSTLQLYI